MKRALMQIALVGVAVVYCSGAARAEDTTTMDKKFVADSTQDSLTEIAAAKLALSKSGDANVKTFASKMIQDHTTLIQSMKPLAIKMSVKTPMEPSILDKARIEALKLKSGSSFDRAYVEAMVKDHHADLKKFMEEEQKTSNPEMKAVVAKGEKVIRDHTEMIDGIAQKGGIEVPAMPSM